MIQDDKVVEAPTGSDNILNPMQILEDSLVICKFGRFHIKLLVASFLSVMATTAVTTTTSYILPSAECDLDMTMVQKGLLNSIPFLGQLSAALFTGFMTDAFGRKIFLTGGNFGLFICALFGASSQNYAMLLTGKLLEGILMSLVFSATATMITEFTHKLVRDQVLLAYSSFMPISLIILALLSWASLHTQFTISIVKGYFEIYSWNIYLFICAIWSLLAALMYWQLPESPKFLLSHGQENEALQVLKHIYFVNTGKDEASFPTKSLNVSGKYKPTAKTSVKKQITSALFDAKELFRPPLGWNLLLFTIITFVCLLAYSALRLWFPQLSTIIENYQKANNGNSQRFCVMMSYGVTKNISSSNNISEPEMCEPQLSGLETYTNGALLGFVALIFISISGCLVNCFGQKPLMFIFFVLCGVCSSTLYWTNTSIQAAILISGACAFMQTAFSLQYSILVRVFPTTVRTIALSVIMMVGRIGSMIGNILFPIMMEIGCMVPFVTLSVISFVVAVSIFFLPNPRKDNMATGDK